MSFLVARTNLAVTKPDQTMLRKEVILFYDARTKSVGVKFVGESPLKGYTFDLMISEINRVAASGVPMPALPDSLS
jgi:hypothetical protein